MMSTQLIDHTEEDSLPTRHKLPNILPFLAPAVQLCRRRLDDVTELQRGDSIMDNHLAHALCQESRAHSRDATPKQLRPMHTPVLVRPSILACNHHCFVQRLAPGTPRQSRGFTNSCVIASYRPIIYSTSSLPASKILRNAINTELFSCNTRNLYKYVPSYERVSFNSRILGELAMSISTGNSCKPAVYLGNWPLF